MNSAQPPVTGWRTLRKRLFAPAAVLVDPGQRRQAELLAWISLILSLWFALTAFSIWLAGSQSQANIVFIGVALVGLGAYGFSRSARYGVAAWMLTLLLLGAGYAELMFDPSPYAPTSYLALLGLTFAIGSVALPVRGLSAIVVANTLAWMVWIIFAPKPLAPGFYAAAGSGTILGIFLAIFSGVRDLVERERLQAVHTANAALKEIQSHLEERIAERTATVEAARRDSENARAALAQQNWLNQHQLDITQSLAGQLSLEQLAQRALRGICQALNAPLGAMYVWNAPRLWLAGGYALSPEQMQTAREFALGEGLIGQVAQTQQPIFLHPVPHGYFQLVSGLGQVTPRHLVVWAINYDTELVGVLELGLMQALESHQQQLLQRVSETIGLALQTTQTRLRIDELLLETQAQTEALQAQETELRAMNPIPNPMR